MKKIIKEFLLGLIKSTEKYSKKKEIYRLIKNKQLIVGSYTYGITNLFINNYKGSESKVKIGKFCSIGPNITIITGGIHPKNWISTFPIRIRLDLINKYEDGMPYTNGDVNIGNDVWIGTGVTILSGITIGDGAIIAANSLVSKDVEPYSIVGGNPAKLIKYRFSTNEINHLKKIQWWEWNEDKIIENVSYINSSSIKNFIDLHK